MLKCLSKSRMLKRFYALRENGFYRQSTRVCKSVVYKDT